MNAVLRNKKTSAQKRKSDPSRKKRKSCKTVYTIDSDGIAGDHPISHERDEYFRIYRQERLLLRRVAESPFNLTADQSFLNYPKGDLKVLRIVYYRLLPYLFGNLFLPADRALLLHTEWRLFTFLRIIYGMKDKRVSRLYIPYITNGISRFQDRFKVQDELVVH